MIFEGEDRWGNELAAEPPECHEADHGHFREPAQGTKSPCFHMRDGSGWEVSETRVTLTEA